MADGWATFWSALGIAISQEPAPALLVARIRAVLASDTETAERPYAKALEFVDALEALLMEIRDQQSDLHRDSS